MKTIDYLKVLVEEIHSTVVATTGKDGEPVTRVIDMMLYDEDGLYFLTGRGKDFYEQLMEHRFISLTGMTREEHSIERKSVSLRGKIRSIGKEKMDEIFEKNPYMAQIYPDPENRDPIEVFQIYEGTGEYFDLSTVPITRESFTLGQTETKKEEHGYFINENCMGCMTCYNKCPQKCIDTSDVPFVIDQAHCLHCGNCFEFCPFGAVEKRG